MIILGAAGRDFHNFNVYFRGHAGYKVVAFTATQIPNIEGRTYPSELAGPLYPKGIPILPQEPLRDLIETHNVDEVVHAYSDVSHEEVMHTASTVLAAGADFRLMGPGSTCLTSKRPVIAVCAVRTGAGKSPTSQFIADYLTRRGLRVGVVRHPMPYGNLAAMEVQRFSKYEDLLKHKPTLEEREEYEPYVRRSIVVWAGVDYRKILRRAEKEADVILWDGGNNDLPFYTPDLHITLVDPHRAGHETTYHPGEANLRAADVVLISKTGTASPEDVEAVLSSIQSVNPKARVFRTDLKIAAARGPSVRNKTVVVIEDGPTLTHGDMAYGAGAIFAKNAGATLIDPSRYAVGSMKKIYEDYPHLKKVLPAMGYGSRQVREFESTINKPLIQVRYALAVPAGFKKLLREFAKKAKAVGS